MTRRLFSVVILLAAIALASCASSSRYVLPYKSWHISPAGDSQALARIPVVDWKRVQRLYIGMSDTHAAQTLNVSLADMFYKGNLIVWSKTSGDIPIEVAYRLSEDRTITDISYRQRP